MKYALFLVEVEDTPASRDRLGMFETNSAYKAEILSSSSKLLPGVWLLRLEYGLQPLLTLSEIAQGARLATRILFFENEPSWLITPCIET